MPQTRANKTIKYYWEDLHAGQTIELGSVTVEREEALAFAGRYDPQNTADTWKGMVDELVDMGVLDEDNYRHVLGPLAYHHGIDRKLPTGYLRAVVTLTDDAEEAQGH